MRAREEPAVWHMVGQIARTSHPERTLVQTRPGSTGKKGGGKKVRKKEKKDNKMDTIVPHAAVGVGLLGWVCRGLADVPRVPVRAERVPALCRKVLERASVVEAMEMPAMVHVQVVVLAPALEAGKRP